MNSIKSIGRSVAALMLAFGALWCFSVSAEEKSHWVMTLSWSPQYCELNKNSTEPQCTDESYFVNFGLKAPDRVGDAHVGDSCPKPHLKPEEEDRWLWTIPNLERVRYVWAEQGACTGLDQHAFYSQMDYASRRVAIPSEYSDVQKRVATSPLDIKAAFVAANPGLTDDHIALHCDAHWLTEVRVCFDSDMQYQECVVGGDCSNEIWLRPLRPDKRASR